MATPGDRSGKGALAKLFTATSASHDAFGTPLFTHFGELLVELVQPQPGNRVLDVAAGVGATLVPAATRVGQTGHVTGIDVAPGMVQRLADRIAQAGLTNSDVAVADGEALPFHDESFDVVLCAFAIFFLDEPAQAVRGFWRVLREGGVLGISTFSTAGSVSMDRIWQHISAFTEVPPPASPERRFDDASVVTRLLTDAGFEGIEVHLSRLEVVFDDVEAWYSWLWSMEFRESLAQMDEESIERLKSAAALDFARQPGSAAMSFPMDALLTRCQRPVPRTPPPVSPSD